MEDIAPLDGVQHFQYPHRASDYAYRVPTPPRIVVPPPTLNADALPDITLNALRNNNFLNGINYNNLVKENAPLEWTYERRREAQMILPYLYLGPMNAVKDKTFLHREAITMVLGIRQRHTSSSRLMAGALRAADELGIQKHTVDLANNQELIHAFPHTTDIINAHLGLHHQASGGGMGKVLVFCESGNERSAGVVAAYLMEVHQDVDFIKAMQLCQAQRFCVNFDDAMKRLLQGYWDILCAKRMVGTAEGPVGNHGFGNVQGDGKMKGKRGLVRDEDEEMEGGDDVARFGGRDFAPFVDEAVG